MNLRCSETVILSIKFQNNLPQILSDDLGLRQQIHWNILEPDRYCPVNFKCTSTDEPPTISWTQDSKYILSNII